MLLARGLQPDQKRIIASLATEFHASVADVASLYERERAGIATGAHITKFLHIFATRNCRAILRQRAVDKPAAAAC